MDGRRYSSSIDLVGVETFEPLLLFLLVGEECCRVRHDDGDDG